MAGVGATGAPVGGQQGAHVDVDGGGGCAVVVDAQAAVQGGSVAAAQGHPERVDDAGAGPVAEGAFGVGGHRGVFHLVDPQLGWQEWGQRVHHCATLPYLRDWCPAWV